MNVGPGNPSGGQGKGRRRRGRRPAGAHRGNPANSRDRQTQGVYSAPMDHSYRANQGGDNGGTKGGRNGRGPRAGFVSTYQSASPDPVPAGMEASAPPIFAFVDDLFFLTRIQETARKLNVKVEFLKNDKDLAARFKPDQEKPSLIIFDLNNVNAKPLTLIPKLKSKLKKGTSIIGFLSHVQGELKLKAHEAGCDMVLPRSAFSQNLPQLLRRHGAPEEELAEQQGTGL